MKTIRINACKQALRFLTQQRKANAKLFTHGGATREAYLMLVVERAGQLLPECAPMLEKAGLFGSAMRARAAA